VPVRDDQGVPQSSAVVLATAESGGELAMSQVYFNLPAADLEAVDALAEMRDGNRSEVLRQAVADYLYGTQEAVRADERRRILAVAERIKEPHRRPGTGEADYAVPLVLLLAELVPKAGSPS
jgi:predicted transcriptional regulator